MSRRAALAWLLSPALLTLAATVLAATPAQAAAGISYVALGDSYSAGVGAPGESGVCNRSPAGFPQLWADRHDVTTFVTVACGGATTTTLLATQLEALNRSVNLVTVTIGGNDAGFVPTVASCLVASDSGCASAVGVAHRYVHTVLPTALTLTYAAIRAAAPHARVVVLGYPRLFDTSGGCPTWSLAKRRALNAGADDLDALIRARAGTAGFTYVDVRDAFADHGVCANQPWINGVLLSHPGDSFHPTAAGYLDGYLPALDAVVD